MSVCTFVEDRQKGILSLLFGVDGRTVQKRVPKCFFGFYGFAAFFLLVEFPSSSLSASLCITSHRCMSSSIFGIFLQQYSGVPL